MLSLAPAFILFSSFFAGILASNHFAGINAANSKGGANAYTCRTQADWNNLASTAKDSGFKAIRILGFDCNALDLASDAAARNGLQVLAGIYISGSVASAMTQINNEVQLFRQAYQKYGAGRYVGLTIGNEVNDATGSIMAKVYDVRGYLRSVGVSTPVSTVHTWVRIRDEPALCGGDFVGANAHAFYDGNVASGDAGNFVFSTVVPSLKSKCPGKKIIITESGWPSRGNRFGSKAVASSGDERSAISSLNCASARDPSVSLYAFEADDQLWKGNDNERSFGLFNKVKFNGDILNAC
ncbi:glycoside hydrolase [Agrocybe pediades]|nr:glycoside hydrolase [Agrocybe pediades]